MKNKNKIFDASDLRMKAEERISADKDKANKSQQQKNMKETLHELQVHQIELEMQNEELLQTQHQLEASRAGYFDLYDMAPCGYLTLNENGIIIEVNLTLCTMLCLTKDAILKKLFTQFIFPEDQDIYYRHRKQLFETAQHQKCDLRMLKNDKTLVWTHIEADLVHDKDGNSSCRIIISDASERKLEENEHRLTASLIFLVNAQENFQECIHSLTDSLQVLSGCEAVGIRLKSGKDYPYFETKGFPPQFVQAEKYLCAHDQNSNILLDSSGNPILTCMCGNILSGRFDPSKPFFTENGSFWSNNTTALLASTNETDRQATTRNRCNGEGYESVALIPLRTEEEIFGLLQFNDHRSDRFTKNIIMRFERIASSLAIALLRRQNNDKLLQNEFYLNKAQEIGKIGHFCYDQKANNVEGSPQLFRIFDVNQEQSLFKAFTESVHPEDRDLILPFIDKALKEGIPYDVEHRILHRNGTVLFVRARGEIINTLKGQRMVGIVQDITKEKKTEEALRNVQKLESLGILASGIAHDFNNLLGGVFGYVNLAQEYLGINKINDAISTLSQAMDIIDQSRYLSNQLLTFAKGGSPVKKLTYLQTLIQNSASLALSGSNVSCIFDMEADLLPCDCDKNQLVQVISNIVVNARQAMPNGGTIRIIAKKTSLKPLEEISAPKGGDFLQLSIVDQGVGIPQNIIHQIFDPFFTTKEKGHGLGLAISHSIIKRHDGWMKIESEPGKGTTFHIFLPASKDKAIIKEAAIITKHSGAGSILIMDDDKYLRDFYDQTLKLMGYAIKLSKNGEEAIELFKNAEKSKQPFLLTILDLTIKGGMGGLETVKEIRKLNPQAIVIVSSGYANDPVMANPKEYGFSDSIAKPFLMKDLSALFLRLFEKK